MTAVKVVRFLDREPEGLRGRWAQALAAGDPVGRPSRVAVAVPLSGFPEPPFAAVDLQWFPDVAEALANEAWLASVDPELAAGSCRVVVEEVVVRGQDYLAGRWKAGGDRYKMMSFGRRHPDLTPVEFSAQWRGHAGRLGGEQIPDEVRGLAYVQNHPVPVEGHEWPFDAVNEVWFERLDDLRRRRDWFAARPGAVPSFMSPDHLWSMFVRESPL